MKFDRKVGRHHLAFYRGWLQGLNLGDMADRYLETGKVDLRRAKETLRWLRDVIQQAALRNGKHGMARLLRLQIQVAMSNTPETAAAPLPSLAEFRENYDPDGFFTEKELIQAYTEQYPQSVDDSARRRQRIIERQLRALSWVEELLATEPQPDDLVSAWFDKTIADRLMLAGIPNLRALTAHISARGYRWWVTVPRMGKEGAKRILNWLQTYEETLGSVPSYALVPKRQLQPGALVSCRPVSTGIVPMESLLVPGDLDGSAGLNRYHGQPKIEAQDDLQAVRKWISGVSVNPNTQRAYLKEAERMVLWALMERRKALSDLTVDDCAAYRDWISMLGRTQPENWTFRIPQEQWLKQGTRAAERHHADWRPFDGPLSERSVKYALGVLMSMFTWLAKVRYLDFNPWSGVALTTQTDENAPPTTTLSRSLSKGQWSYLLEYLDQREESARTRQLRFAIKFAYMAGLRRSELVKAKTKLLFTEPSDDGPTVRWMLNVLGKGGKWRAVPMLDGIMEALGDYLESRGLARDPQDNPPDTPLIADHTGKSSISADALYKAFKEVFREVAEKLESEGKKLEAKVFRSASTHWMRHTRGHHLGSDGTPIPSLQQFFGHADPATSSIYTKSDNASLWDELAAHT